MVAVVNLSECSSFLVSSSPYQGNQDRNHKLWNIGSTGRYIFHMQVLFLGAVPITSHYYLQ
jgi:hypothetical protein